MKGEKTEKPISMTRELLEAITWKCGLRAHLEVAMVKLPGSCSKVLQQATFMGEGEVEAQVSTVLSEGHLP